MEMEDTKTDFLLEPYIARGGITLLWGESSIGKSPLTWQMAASIARGWGFYGLPVQQGKVLYIELDTPRDLIKSRIKLIENPPEEGLDFLFLPPLSAPTVHPDDLQLLKEAGEGGYDLVFVNTLRKCHSLNDKEPQTVKVVYEFFQRIFPGAALVFIHHAKKSTFDQSGDSLGKSRESFSGAQNWFNDAQTAMQLLHRRNEHGGVATNLELRHEKSQVGRQYRALLLQLKEDGTNFQVPMFDELQRTYDLVASGDWEGERLSTAIAAELGLGRTQAYARRKIVEEGRFPGVWLSPKD
jgi:RecA-family ATPase